MLWDSFHGDADGLELVTPTSRKVTQFRTKRSDSDKSCIAFRNLSIIMHGDATRTAKVLEPEFLQSSRVPT